jgi:hypothetical protein
MTRAADEFFSGFPVLSFEKSKRVHIFRDNDKGALEFRPCLPFHRPPLYSRSNYLAFPEARVSLVCSPLLLFSVRGGFINFDASPNAGIVHRRSNV